MAAMATASFPFTKIFSDKKTSVNSIEPYEKPQNLTAMERRFMRMQRIYTDFKKHIFWFKSAPIRSNPAFSASHCL
jgi:hypothetical protein